MCFGGPQRLRWRWPGSAGTPPAISGAPPADKATGDRRVFILQSYDLGDTFAANTLAGLSEAFRDSGLQVELFAESLDANRTALTPAYLEQFAALLRAKYAGVRFDALTVMGQDAFEFL